MKILITGGAGFIGSHLAERCLNDGYAVSIVDDLSTGSLENLQVCQKHPAFRQTIASIFDAATISRLVADADIVFHLAATVGVRLVIDSPVRTIETNVHGAEVVLRAAAQARKRVVLASTSEVYGKGATLPFREDDDLVLGATTSSRWSYACSKMLDEFLGLAYWTEQRVPVTIVRLFNTVGPRQIGRYGMVLPTFVQQALTGAPITVYGSGAQSRCFAHVHDVVEALTRVAVSERTVGEVINIGNDREITINDLASLVKQVTESSSTIRRIPYSKAYGPGFEDMFRRVPSLEKLERLVAYRPSTAIEEIVRSVVEDLSPRISDPAAA